MSVRQMGQRVVVKIGSTLITNNGFGIDHALIQDWVAQIARLVALGYEVLLVSSGAIAEGMQRLGWKTRPHEVNQLQAAAAVGQMGLVQVYETAFRQHDLGTAQILLTHDDLADRKRYLNARSTLQTLLSLRVVPVINENDTVVTDEIKFGDNDTLAALVCNLVEADQLVILTDQQGLFDADPRKNPDAALIYQGRAGDSALEQMAGGSGSHLGRGGMLTKVLAAKKAALSGASTRIAYGRERDVLVRLMQGEAIGTRLVAESLSLQAKKTWLAGYLKTSGKVRLDDGAVRALVHEGKSLLPVGVIAVEGVFDRGEVVSCFDVTGQEIARGLVNYASHEVVKIARQPTREIESLLGFIAEPELIHRDNLVLL
ncbi:MAG: glutamate 5-kinase [Betaproteobacteria bacterium]|nr:glutamate 5-kinase [Betaproteobacteria bacterium]